MSAQVLLSFDFDAESPWVCGGEDASSLDLTQRSLGAYGRRRGIVRISDLLEELEIPCTFFVPGWTADRYPDRVRDLFDRGHEIAHHGYNHVPPVALSADRQREDLARGIEAIANCTGTAPVGYRSPSWQLTPATLALLREFDFAYDSSCMGDDRPYVESFDDDRIVELPVHWTLDDFPHLGWTPGVGGPLRDAAELIDTWRREVVIAIREDRPIILTCHPEFVGRPGAIEELGGFVRSLKEDVQATFGRCIDLARAVSPRLLDE